MAESENIIPTSYRDSGEAIKMAAQIRRPSVVVQEYSGFWKLIVINNRYKLEEDLETLDLSDNDGYVHINDNQGPVQRAKVQLNPEDILYFARIIGDYIGADNPICLNFNNPAQRIRSLIAVEKTEEKKPDSEEDDDRSGLYEVQPIEFYCYFKRFRPAAMIIEQDVGTDSYNSFTIYITLNDKSHLDMIIPAFRKGNQDIDAAYGHLSKNKAIELRLDLKPQILKRIKFKMFANDNINVMLQLRNPVNKGILNNISNYVLEEVRYL
jgi:hypothetical protein